jgi:hypothetical protein
MLVSLLPKLTVFAWEVEEDNLARGIGRVSVEADVVAHSEEHVLF